MRGEVEGIQKSGARQARAGEECGDGGPEEMEKGSE
jgi:hypothetical protein